MTDRLSYRNAQGKLVTVALAVNAVHIGRDSSCELRVADILLSGVHCRVVRREAGWRLEDLGSANRTFVNDNEAPLGKDESHALRDRDIIRCGGLWIQFRSAAAELPVEALEVEMEPDPPLAGPDPGALQADLTATRQMLRMAEARIEEQRSELATLRSRAQAAQERVASLETIGDRLAVFSRQVTEKEQQQTQLQARVRTLEESAAIASKEASAARAEGKHLLEQLKRGREQLESSETSLARALKSFAELNEELQSLRLLGQEKDKRLELLASAPSTQAIELHALHEKTQQQAARLRALETERDAQRHAQQQSRLALEQLEAENRALRQEIDQLQRLTLASRPGDGASVAELTKKTGQLASQLDDTKQALAEQRQVFTSLYESLETVILELGERMFALKKGYLRQTESLADRETVKLSVANIDRMMDEIQNAQGQLRALQRLLNSES